MQTGLLSGNGLLARERGIFFLRNSIDGRPLISKKKKRKRGEKKIIEVIHIKENKEGDCKD